MLLLRGPVCAVLALLATLSLVAPRAVASEAPPADTASTSAGTTFARLVDDGYGYLGSGRVWRFGDQVQASGTAHHVHLELDNEWTVDIAAPGEQALTAVRYDDVARAGFGTATQAGLEIGRGHRGCSAVTGWFEVLEIAFEDSGELSAFRARFDHRCDGEESVLRGELAWRATPTGRQAYPPPVVTIGAPALVDWREPWSVRIDALQSVRQPVTVTVQPTAGGPTATTTGIVGDDGTFSMTLRGTASSFVRAEVEGTKTQRLLVAVRTRVHQRVVGRARRQQQVLVVRPADRAALVVGLSSGATGCIALETQVRVPGGWSPSRPSRCSRVDDDGSVSLPLWRRHLVGSTVRVRPEFRRDRWSATTDAHGTWTRVRPMH